MDYESIYRNATSSLKLETVIKTTEVIYVFKQDIFETRNVYKIGKTMDIIRRESDYKTVLPYGRMVFAAKCCNSVESEKLIFKVLERKHDARGEVVYDVSLDVLKAIINAVIADEKKANTPSVSIEPIDKSDIVPSIIKRDTQGTKTNHQKPKNFEELNKSKSIYEQYIDDNVIFYEGSSLSDTNLWKYFRKYYDSLNIDDDNTTFKKHKENLLESMKCKYARKAKDGTSWNNLIIRNSFDHKLSEKLIAEELDYLESKERPLYKVTKEIWSHFSVNTLKDYCSSYKEVVGGKKSDLIERLLRRDLTLSNLDKSDLTSLCSHYKVQSSSKKMEMTRKLSDLFYRDSILKQNYQADLIVL
jgi:hypothetical protein